MDSLAELRGAYHYSSYWLLATGLAWVQMHDAHAAVHLRRSGQFFLLTRAFVRARHLLFTRAFPFVRRRAFTSAKIIYIYA